MSSVAILYVLIGASALLAIQSLFDFSKENKQKRSINKRLKVQSETESLAEAVVELRQRKGLDEFGNRRI